MRKIILIAKREYVARVRNRAFFISTLLTPVFFLLLIAGSIYFTKPISHRNTHSNTITSSGNNDDATSETSAEGEGKKTVAYAVGFISGLLIYITMMVYGMMVLRGVMEEKNNRIAEVIISSVRPFQLMMGKITGIGLVGITQFALWIVLILLLSTAASSLLSPGTLEQIGQLRSKGGMMPGGTIMQAGENAGSLLQIKQTLHSFNWPLIIVCFIFYFIGGYIFYAALFAAVGSVMDDSQNMQSLSIPITMPIVFSFLILTSAIQAPNSELATWASIIPFTSSTVMMARIAHGVPGTVPYWQLLLSIVLLIAGFIFTTWMAGKIYRTGLLMYGKKVTWKEMMKWAFRA